MATKTLEEQYGDRITTNDNGSVNWLLTVPLATADGTVDSITLRRPKLREMKSMKGPSDVAKTAWLISSLSGVAPPYLDELDGEDFTVLGRVIGRFLGADLGTGDE